jgi:hypothetical protein
MLLVILAVWFGYKKGRDSGRNGVLWGAICGAAYLGVQILVGFGVGGLMGLGIALWGWPEDIFEKYQLVFSGVGIVASVITILVIFRYLDRIPDEPVLVEPPPPPRFDDADVGS